MKGQRFVYIRYGICEKKSLKTNRFFCVYYLYKQTPHRVPYRQLQIEDGRGKKLLIIKDQTQYFSNIHSKKKLYKYYENFRTSV